MKKLIVAIMILLSTAAGLQAKEFELDRVVAVVNKKVITWAELYRAMEFDYGQKMNFLSEDEKRKFLKENEKGYLDNMIDTSLQLQEADRLNMTVEPGEVREAINSIKHKYSMDDAAFAEALKKEGFTLDEYKKKLSEQILISKLVSKEVKDKINVSDSEVKKYIAEKGLDKAGESVYKLSQIFFPMPEKPEDKGQLEQKADEALRKVRSGDDFMTVASVYSQADPDLGMLKRDVLSDKFLSVIDKMKPGDVSDPFWTSQGLFIIKLQDRISPEDKDALMQKARKELTENKFEQVYKEWLKNLAEKSMVEIRL